MTKEECEKIRKRLCNEYYHKDKNCLNCPIYTLKGTCNMQTIEMVLSSFEIMEKWAEEHPAKTNRDKFEEVFGIKVKADNSTYVGLPCKGDGNLKECMKISSGICGACLWWDEEYTEPKGEE